MPTKSSPVLSLAHARPSQRIGARQIGNVPDAPYVPLYLAEQPEAEVAKVRGLVVGHIARGNTAFVYQPVRFPLMLVRTLLVCVEYVDVRLDDSSDVMASFKVSWLNGNGSVRGMYTEPMLLQRDGGVFRFSLPVVSAELHRAVEAGAQPTSVIEELVDTDIAFSCGLSVSVLTEGAGVILRSVWLELGD